LNPKCGRSIISGIPKILSPTHSARDNEKKPAYHPGRKKAKMITEELKNGYRYPEIITS
jgi:hypothetical protein